jgi:hypothetical protein
MISEEYNTIDKCFSIVFGIKLSTLSMAASAILESDADIFIHWI